MQLPHVLQISRPQGRAFLQYCYGSLHRRACVVEVYLVRENSRVFVCAWGAKNVWSKPDHCCIELPVVDPQGLRVKMSWEAMGCLELNGLPEIGPCVLQIASVSCAVSIDPCKRRVCSSLLIFVFTEKKLILCQAMVEV